MKISIITKLVIGAMVATIVTGCGGSGASLPDNAFKSGLYFSLIQPDSVNYINGIAGVGGNPINLPSGWSPSALHIGNANQLYVGAGNTILCYANKTSAPVSFQFSDSVHTTNIYKIATDSLGRIYANDFNNNRILRIDNMNGDNLTILDYTSFMNNGLGDDIALAVDSQNRIYIGPRTTNKIIRFDTMTDANPVKFGTGGNGVDQFNEITDIAFDSSGRIYIADELNNRIVRIDDMTGANWTSFGTNGSGVNQFNSPFNVAIGPDDSICVGDPKNNRIVRFTDMGGSNWSSYNSNLTNLTDIMVR